MKTPEHIHSENTMQITAIYENFEFHSQQTVRSTVRTRWCIYWARISALFPVCLLAVFTAVSNNSIVKPPDSRAILLHSQRQILIAQITQVHIKSAFQNSHADILSWAKFYLDLREYYIPLNAIRRFRYLFREPHRRSTTNSSALPRQRLPQSHKHTTVTNRMRDHSAINDNKTTNSTELRLSLQRNKRAKL